MFNGLDRVNGSTGHMEATCIQIDIEHIARFPFTQVHMKLDEPTQVGSLKKESTVPIPKRMDYILTNKIVLSSFVQ